MRRGGGKRYKNNKNLFVSQKTGEVVDKPRKVNKFGNIKKKSKVRKEGSILAALRKKFWHHLFGGRGKKRTNEKSRTKI